MLTRFLCDSPSVDVTYGVGVIRPPVPGEFIRADGEDDSFPEGLYRVFAVTWVYGIRGPRSVAIQLSCIVDAEVVEE